MSRLARLHLGHIVAPTNDQEHFQDYREQTHLKHEILAAYLPAYFKIIQHGSRNLVYIDGFAGRGKYKNADTSSEADGSPLLTLKLIAKAPNLADKVSTIFIESDKTLFEQLQQNVDEFFRAHQNIRKPECINGTFAECVTDVVRQVDGNLAPTFLFVDPCGVSGTSLKAIQQVMDCDKCEAFIFFNMAGTKRIAGLPKVSPALKELLGTTARAEKLYEAIRRTDDAHGRNG